MFWNILDTEIEKLIPTLDDRESPERFFDLEIMELNVDQSNTYYTTRPGKGPQLNLTVNELRVVIGVMINSFRLQNRFRS